MNHPSLPANHLAWLQTLSLSRAAFSFVWVALAFTVAEGSAPITALLLVVYPAWDALANLVDAKRAGGIAAHPTQALNAAVSAVATAAMGIAVGRGMSSVFLVFGAWAVVAGLLQLGTALRRWRHLGAQWPMALSGAQSALAGAFFMKQAGGASPRLLDLAGYAAVGALYFAVSAGALLHRRHRLRTSLAGG